MSRRSCDRAYSLVALLARCGFWLATCSHSKVPVLILLCCFVYSQNDPRSGGARTGRAAAQVEHWRAGASILLLARLLSDIRLPHSGHVQQLLSPGGFSPHVWPVSCSRRFAFSPLAAPRSFALTLVLLGTCTDHGRQLHGRRRHTHQGKSLAPICFSCWCWLLFSTCGMPEFGKAALDDSGGCCGCCEA